MSSSNRVNRQRGEVMMELSAARAMAAFQKIVVRTQSGRCRSTSKRSLLTKLF